MDVVTIGVKNATSHSEQYLHNYVDLMKRQAEAVRRQLNTKFSIIGTNITHAERTARVGISVAPV